MRALEMRWGVLFQEGALFSSQTVAENIQVPLREYTAMSQELMDEIAAMKLAHGGPAARHGAEISLRTVRRHEEARRPGARAGAGPELLFLDEPTSGLDPISANSSTN